MNDRKTIKPNLFKKNLNYYIKDIKHGSPICKIILIEPNHSEDYNETYMKDYSRIRYLLSKKDENIFYYSIPKMIGDYSYFKKNNMMLDKVHPNQKGNKIIGNSIFEFYQKIR